MTGILYGGVQGFWVRTYIFITTQPLFSHASQIDFTAKSRIKNHELANASSCPGTITFKVAVFFFFSLLASYQKTV